MQADEDLRAVVVYVGIVAAGVLIGNLLLLLVTK